MENKTVTKKVLAEKGVKVPLGDEFNSIEEADDFTDLPSWIVEEVTHDPTYLNCNLARK